MIRRLRRPGGLSLFALLALLSLVPLAPAAGAGRSVRFDGRVVQAPAGWPVFRLGEHPRMCVRLDRRVVYLGTPSGAAALPGRGDWPAAGDPRRTRGCRRLGVARPAPAGHGLSRRRRLHRARLRRLHRPLLALDGRLGGLALPRRRRLHRRHQPRLLAAEPDRELGRGPDRSRLAPDPDLRRPAGADQRLLQLRQAELQPGDRAGRRRRRSTRSKKRAQWRWGPAARSTSTWSPTARPRARPPRRSPSSRPGPKSCTRSATSPASTAAAPRGSRTSPARSAPATSCPTTSGSPTGTASRHRRPGRSRPAPGRPHRRIHQYRGGHNESYGGVTINIDNNYVDGATVGSATLVVGDNPVGYLDLARRARPGQVRVRGWAFDPNAPTEPLAIRALGRRQGRDRRAPQATSSAPSPPARAATSPPSTRKPGPQPRLRPQPADGEVRAASAVCAYALNIAPGEDRLLGCKGATIPVALRLSHLQARRQRGAGPGRLPLARRHRVPRADRAPLPLPGRRAARRGGPRGPRPVSRVVGRARLPPHRRRRPDLPGPAQRRRPRAAAPARAG